MSAVYTIIILALFALGMPVAFVLLLGGVLGMLFGFTWSRGKRGGR